MLRKKYISLYNGYNMYMDIMCLVNYLYVTLKCMCFYVTVYNVGAVTVFKMNM